ncbi:tyrosine-type recombinase/integrase [Kitasatospora sp. NPDC058032]|uniref:tyrosine-type recombinase/integrase n=1 Tax=Kitasatospora sp. NPDC058032 TaxID=3346307 RepID=UPI0036DF0E13
MPRKKVEPTRRRFGNIRQHRSGRWGASYRDAAGTDHNAPHTFETKTDAEVWLTLTEADIKRGTWIDPNAGKVLFKDFSAKWVEERGLMPTTEELYQRLLRLHLLPTFGDLALNEITSATVRTWHAKRKQATGATTVAKSYRLLKSIMETAADDEAIPRNPCRIKGAGEEHPDERPVATVAQVFELAELMGPRWQFMIFLGAFATLRPEELAALRREDVNLDKRTLRITEAAPQLNNGTRVTGPTKSKAGKRTIHLPSFLDVPMRQHMAWFAEDGPQGYLFVGEKGARLRATTFGKKFAKARAKVGKHVESPFRMNELTRSQSGSEIPLRLVSEETHPYSAESEAAEEAEEAEQMEELPKNFTFYDLRHTGNSLLAEEGASLKDLMVRMGQSSVRAAMIYQHSTERRQRQLAAKLDSRVRGDIGRTPPTPPAPPSDAPDSGAVVRPIRRQI